MTKSVRVVGRVVKFVVFLVVLGVIASVAGPLIDASKDVRDAVARHPVAGRDRRRRRAAAARTPEKEAVAPVGLSSTSMLTRRNFDAPWIGSAAAAWAGCGRCRSAPSGSTPSS